MIPALAEEKKKREEAWKAKKAAEAAAAAKKEASDEDANAEEQVDAAPAVDVEMENAELQVPEVTVSRMKKVDVTEKQEKKVFHKVEVPVQFVSYMQMTAEQKKAIVEREEKMAAFDAECHRVQEARNNLETYVLDAQGHFADGGDFYEYMTPTEAENFMNSLFQMDDWLADDDFNQTSQVYQSKLDEVKTVGDIYEVRAREFTKRAKALTVMKKNSKHHRSLGS